MKKVKTLILLCYEASRNGGIQEVARSSYESISSLYPETKIFLIQLKGNKPLRLLKLVLVNVFFLIKHDCQCIVFHASLLKFLLFRPKNLICWAYGIEVWGPHGYGNCCSLNKVTEVWSISEYTTKQLRLNNVKQQIFKIPLCTGEKMYQLPYQERSSYPFTIVTLARLSSKEKYKGHDLTIRAVHQLAKENINITYVIIGTGDDCFRLKRLSEELGVVNNIKFLGYLEDKDVTKVLSSCSAFVMPSFIVKNDSADIPWRGEGLGIAYIEAGLHSLPVIACDEGGQTDCIIDGHNGILVQPDVDSLSDAIKHIYLNPQYRLKLGRSNYNFMNDNYSPKTFAQAIKVRIDKNLSI